MILGFVLAWVGIAMTIGLLWILAGLLAGLDWLWVGEEEEPEDELPFTLHPECFDKNGNLIQEPWYTIAFYDNERS